MINEVDEDDFLTHGVLVRRVLAWLVDMALIGLGMAVLYVVVMLFGLLTLGLGLVLLGALPCAPPLYNFLFLLTRRSATPGQVLLGLCVRRDDDLGPPTPLQALLSTAGFYLTLATGVIWLAAALFTVRRRTLHDMFAGLVMVRTDSLTSFDGSWNMHSA
jgi:uncharacterized RDD family membrane protein YckC